MDKKTYLTILRNELKKVGVAEIDDIINEYTDHFDSKQKLGKTEEEIANKLASPEYIAKEYAQSIDPKNTNPNYGKITMTIGLGFIDIIMVMILIVLIGWVIVLGVFSITLIVLCFLLFTNLNIVELIPYLPYYGKVLIGLSTLSLSVLSGLGTIYSFIYIKQWTKVYLRWHKNMLNNGIYPKLSLNPEKVVDKINLRLLMMISLILFGSFLIITMILLMIDANAFEFWHEWNWFQ